MSVWDGLENANTFERGTFFQPGRYTVKIKNCIEKNTRSVGKAYIVEFEILSSSDPVNHPVGSSASWFQKLADRDIAFGAIAEFMAAVYQKDLRNREQKLEFERDVKPRLPQIADASTKQNIFKDRTVALEVAKVKTKKGLDFSRHQWSPG